jgi:hypothetical protein
VRLVSNNAQDVVLEAVVRWNAKDAQLALLIEPVKGLTLVPKLKHIHVYATVRVILKPLLPRLPCFGAITVALTQPPLVNFELDFGTLDVGKVRLHPPFPSSRCIGWCAPPLHRLAYHPFSVFRWCPSRRAPS